MEDRQPEKEDVVLMILIALAAWAIENDEPFNVDPEIFQNIVESNIETGFIPELAIDNADGRLKIGVFMREPKESDYE